MTTDDETPAGFYEVYNAINRARVMPDQLVDELGVKGMNWLIQQFLDRHYPVDIFPVGGHSMAWSSEHGGDDIDPGVKWVAHLREALRMVPDAK